MRGVRLFESMRLFGKKDGFSFWFNWSIKSPIECWVWLNITHKSYCLHCGWYCNEDCKEKKLYTKQDILKHWEEMRKELDKVEIGKDGMCIYCGEEKGEVQIPNPNFDKLSQWLICRNCEEIIKSQREVSIGVFTKNNSMINNANKKLEEIAKRTGKPILNVQIHKKKDGGYDSASIEFTGE